jgi:hypothetical protein
MRGILLAPLVDAGQADCSITTKGLDSTGKPVNNLQLVSLVGNPGTPANATFTLTFNGQTTKPIAWNASNTQMQTALAALSSIGTNNVTVALGKQTYTNSASQVQTSEHPGLWIVTFLGQYDPAKSTASTPAPTPALMTVSNQVGLSSTGVVVQKYQWADTGRVETVNAVTPVGTPTPMVAGAVVTCVFYPGLGYGVMTCESRQYSPTSTP